MWIEQTITRLGLPVVHLWRLGEIWYFTWRWNSLIKSWIYLFLKERYTYTNFQTQHRVVKREFSLYRYNYGNRSFCYSKKNINLIYYYIILDMWLVFGIYDFILFLRNGYWLTKIYSTSGCFGYCFVILILSTLLVTCRHVTNSVIFLRLFNSNKEVQHEFGRLAQRI